MFTNANDTEYSHKSHARTPEKGSIRPMK